MSNIGDELTKNNFSICLQEHESGAIAGGKDDGVEKRGWIQLVDLGDADDHEVKSLEVLHDAKGRP